MSKSLLKLKDFETFRGSSKNQQINICNFSGQKTNLNQDGLIEKSLHLPHNCEFMKRFISI